LGFRRRRDRLELGEAVNHFLRGFFDLIPTLGPGPRQSLQDSRKPGPSVAVLGREVGARVEWSSGGVEKGGERPTPGTGHHLQRIHIDRIDVRTLFAVDFDVHEVRVHQRGDRLVLERLTFHHMTPVTGGVTDREKDRAVFAAGAGESLFAPWVPVNRIAGVLEKVGALLPCESVSGRIHP
jgi:hypothetical protein